MDSKSHVVSFSRLLEGWQTNNGAAAVKPTIYHKLTTWNCKLTNTRNLKTKASRKHPKEYKQARARYPSPEY